MGKSIFSKLERATTDSIQQLTERFLLDNLIEEVRLTVQGNDFKFDEWKAHVLNGDIYDHMLPSIFVSMDMGWQK